MANVTITNESYRDANYLDCSIVFNQTVSISGIGLTISGTITIDDVDNEFEDGDYVYVHDVEGTTGLNDRSFYIDNGTAISGSYEDVTMVSGVPTATGIVYTPTTMTAYGLFDEKDLAIDLTSYAAWTSGTGNVDRWATTISGLEHLEGNDVISFMDGAVMPTQTVVLGRITLPYPVKYGRIGLGYDSYMTTMPLEAGNDLGAAIGRRKKIADATLRLYKSLAVRVGPTPNDTDLISFRTSEYDMDEATPLYTGDKRITFKKGFANYQTITVMNQDPVPLTVLAIVPSQLTSPK